jgi:hypothetical protein
VENLCAGKPRYEARVFRICRDAKIPVDTKIDADPNLLDHTTSWVKAKKKKGNPSK